MLIYLILQLSLASEIKPTICYNHDFGDKSKIVIYNTLKQLKRNTNNSFNIHLNKCKDNDIKITVSFTNIKGNAAGRIKGTIKNCNMEIYNKADLEYLGEITFYNVRDLQSTFLHEFGHCIGLKHSVNSDDIMYTTIEPLLHLDKDSYNRFVDSVKNKFDKK